MNDHSMFEREISRENMEVNLADLDAALAPEDFGEAIRLVDKIY